MNNAPKDFDLFLTLDDENEITGYEIGDFKLTPNAPFPEQTMNPQTQMYEHERNQSHLIY